MILQETLKNTLAQTNTFVFQAHFKNSVAWTFFCGAQLRVSYPSLVLQIFLMYFLKKINLSENIVNFILFKNIPISIEKICEKQSLQLRRKNGDFNKFVINIFFFQDFCKLGSLSVFHVRFTSRKERQGKYFLVNVAY